MKEVVKLLTQSTISVIYVMKLVLQLRNQLAGCFNRQISKTEVWKGKSGKWLKKPAKLLRDLESMVLTREISSCVCCFYRH